MRFSLARIDDTEYPNVSMAWLVSITSLFQPVYPTLVLPVKSLTSSGRFKHNGKFQLEMCFARFPLLTVNKPLYKFLYR